MIYFKEFLGRCEIKILLPIIGVSVSEAAIRLVLELYVSCSTTSPTEHLARLALGRPRKEEDSRSQLKTDDCFNEKVSKKLGESLQPWPLAHSRKIGITSSLFKIREPFRGRD